MRIDLAFCVELQRVVDIQEACREFAAQDKVASFHFLCSDPRCRKSSKPEVRVSGINHNRLPEDGINQPDDGAKKVYKTPHYRRWDAHIPDCDWILLEDVSTTASKPEHFTDNNQFNDPTDSRRPIAKVTRLITQFTLESEVASQNRSRHFGEALDSIRNLANPAERRHELQALARRTGSSTSSLEELVSCYEELKNLDALSTELSVRGIGTGSFQEAFSHVRHGPTTGFAVYFGGARLHKTRYGLGFALNFMDHSPIAGRLEPLSLYVPSQSIKESASAFRIVRIIDELTAQPNAYVTAYWVGGIYQRENGKAQASFTCLSHIVLRLKYPAGSTRTLSPEQ